MNDLINVHGSGPVEIVPREAASPKPRRASPTNTQTPPNSSAAGG